LTGKSSLTGKRVSFPIQLSPLAALSHWVSISTPRGETASYPMITVFFEFMGRPGN
jgi:hypothetical protein